MYETHRSASSSRQRIDHPPSSSAWFVRLRGEDIWHPDDLSRFAIDRSLVDMPSAMLAVRMNAVKVGLLPSA
jgi:hypothetical protein